jgi:hypothetical protein
MPEPIIDDISGATTVQSAAVYSTHMGLLDADAIVDGGGNLFQASRFQDGNWTRVYVQKVAMNGQVVGTWQVVAGHGYKIDGLGLTASGSDLLVATVAHDTPNPPPPDGRLSTFAMARIPGVFVPFANQVPKAGAAGAFVQEPTQELDVDYGRIAAIVAAAVDDLAQQFGDDGPRKAIFDKAGDADLYMIDPENYSREYKTARYQDVMFNFIKNANAGVQANILGGQDAWGQARRDELKQIIREVLSEDFPTEPADIAA